MDDEIREQLEARVEALEEYLGGFKVWDDDDDHRDLDEMSWDELREEFLVLGVASLGIAIHLNTDPDGVRSENPNLTDEQIFDRTKKYIIGLRRKLILHVDLWDSGSMENQVKRVREWAEQIESMIPTKSVQ